MKCGDTMDKLLEVREFDTITKNIAFKDDERYRYLTASVFDDLVEFIHEFSSDKDDVDVLNFMRISYRRNIGEIIYVRNYVGIIQLRNGYQIQILPKISLDSGKDLASEKTKRIFLKMIKSMKDFPSKEFNDASLKVDHMNLYEIFIDLFIQETKKLVNYGIKSAYLQQDDNLNFYKGKLLTSQHLKMNFVHKERFYVTFDEFHPNRPENRLIKSTLLKLRRLTKSAKNAKKISQLLLAFEHVSPSVNYKRDFSQVKIDRNTKNYEVLIKWARIFLFNNSFTPFSGNDTARALLFPMERVYESYVAQQINKSLGRDGWKISIQDRGHYLFTEPRRQFALRPDIVCKYGGRIIILDTKWKKLTNNININYGISQSDMYQMYVYSKKYKTSEIWLLYPLNSDMDEQTEIKFDSGDGTVVRVHFVDVAHIETTLEKLKNRLGTIKAE